jgi:hypothetical protein
MNLRAEHQEGPPVDQQGVAAVVRDQARKLGPSGRSVLRGGGAAEAEEEGKSGEQAQGRMRLDGSNSPEAVSGLRWPVKAGKPYRRPSITSR